MPQTCDVNISSDEHSCCLSKHAIRHIIIAKHSIAKKQQCSRFLCMVDKGGVRGKEEEEEEEEKDETSLTVKTQTAKGARVTFHPTNVASHVLLAPITQYDTHTDRHSVAS